MPTLQTVLVQAISGCGLAALGLHYVPGPGDRLTYEGTRPGPDWHAHGWFPSSLLDLRHGRLVQVLIAKPRWLYVGEGTEPRTCHSPPPDDLGLRFSALIVAVELWSWLDAALGVHRYLGLFDDLTDRPTRRTVQRWLAKACGQSGHFAAAARRALLSRIEPRQFERLFPGGLPPPPSARRAWREPNEIRTLHQALAMLLCAAIASETPLASLLAEARRRVDREPFLIG